MQHPIRVKRGKTRWNDMTKTLQTSDFHLIPQENRNRRIVGFAVGDDRRPSNTERIGTGDAQLIPIFQISTFLSMVPKFTHPLRRLLQQSLLSAPPPYHYTPSFSPHHAMDFVPIEFVENVLDFFTGAVNQQLDLLSAAWGERYSHIKRERLTYTITVFFDKKSFVGWRCQVTEKTGFGRKAVVPLAKMLALEYPAIRRLVFSPHCYKAIFLEPLTSALVDRLCAALRNSKIPLYVDYTFAWVNNPAIDSTCQRLLCAVASAYNVRVAAKSQRNTLFDELINRSYGNKTLRTVSFPNNAYYAKWQHLLSIHRWPQFTQLLWKTDKTNSKEVQNFMMTFVDWWVAEGRHSRSFRVYYKYQNDIKKCRQPEVWTDEKNKMTFHKITDHDEKYQLKILAYDVSKNELVDNKWN